MTVGQLRALLKGASPNMIVHWNGDEIYFSPPPPKPRRQVLPLQNHTEIWNAYQSGRRQSEIARAFNTSRQNVHLIIKKMERLHGRS